MEWEDFSQKVVNNYLNGGLEARSQDTEKQVTQKKKENKETERKGNREKDETSKT